MTMATKKEVEDLPPSPDQYSEDEVPSGPELDEPEESPFQNKSSVADLLKKLQSSGALVKKPTGISAPQVPVKQIEPKSEPEAENGSEEESEGGADSEADESPFENKSSVTDLLKKLQSSGALVKKSAVIPTKPVEEKEHHCFTCKITFPEWEELKDHLLEHVILPTILIEKLQSDDESEPDHEPGDENWSDEEQHQEVDIKKKIDVSELLKGKYLSLKSTESSPSKPNESSPLDKLASLGILKKNNTPIKSEQDDDQSEELMNKIGNLGGLKLKLQSTSQGDKNSFKIINGLEKFDPDDQENLSDKEGDNFSVSEEAPRTPVKLVDRTPQTTPIKPNPNVKVTQVLRIIPPNVKTGQNTVIKMAENFEQTQNLQCNPADVVVKNEPVDEPNTQQNYQMLSNEVKSERATPPLSEPLPVTSIPIPSLTTAIKTETEELPTSGVQITEIIEPVVQPKKEVLDPVAVIEINGDSNDEDDDCCVVSTTPAPDIKPKVEPVIYPPSSVPYSVSSASQMSTSAAYVSTPGTRMPAASPHVPASGSILLNNLTSNSYSTEKQHNFNWNAPDTKPEHLLDKSADAIFESLLSSANQKKEPLNMSEASEYISLDNLHTCEVCNIRFTDRTMLENHRRTTGHSQNLVSAGPSALLPAYSSQSNSLLSSLLPVKQLADQVGRLTSVGGAGAPFTHQQNMIINIQAPIGYAGQGMVSNQPQYGAYPGQQAPMPGSNYGQAGNMFRMPGQPGSPFQGQYQQPPSTYSVGNQYMPGAPTYSQASPLQGMQQQVYGGQGMQQMGMQNPMAQNPMGQMQPGQMMQPGQLPGQMQPGQMGAPMAPGQMGSPQFAPPSSPNSMKPPPAPGSIRIQNVQSFNPGQSPTAGAQVRGSGRGGIRPKLGPGIRPGVRPSVRPGVQVQGAIRGMKPGQRMPMKRPGGPVQNPIAKKKMDVLMPGKHDNEDCTVMSMQKQRDGLPMIQSVQGSKDNFSLGSGISVTKKTVNKEASGMANLLASRGIMVKQKAKSRTPSPERPVPHIPNLGSGMSIKHTSKRSEFSIPEARVGGTSITSCRICKKSFMNASSLSVHMSAAHPSSKVPMYRCEECPASYPKPAQLQHHKRVFHNVTGPDREMGLPVVDLSQEDTIRRLSDLGIYSFIPLANREQASGCFGIPVISVHNMNNGMVRGLNALGADGLLSLGPMKPLPDS